MTPAEFTASVTRSVLSFKRDGSLYENTQTGERCPGGTLTFDCGHAYTWRPMGEMLMPRRGDRDMCAHCIESALADFTASASKT